MLAWLAAHWLAHCVGQLLSTVGTGHGPNLFMESRVGPKGMYVTCVLPTTTGPTCTATFDIGLCEAAYTLATRPSLYREGYTVH